MRMLEILNKKNNFKKRLKEKSSSSVFKKKGEIEKFKFKNSKN